MSATTTTTSLSQQEIRLEALRLASKQAPGATHTKDSTQILAKAKRYETYINTGEV